MIASLRTNFNDQPNASMHDRFLAMLPRIRRQALVAFRDRRAEERQELAAEVVANAFRAYVRLVRRGKHDLAYATPLAQFANRQVRDGRRVGGRQSVEDVLSPRARRIHGFTIERLDQRDRQSGTWNQLLVEDRKAGPAETAAARMDVAAWFQTLTKRNRQIAKTLAPGETTGAVARQFGVSPGRVSQLRTWLQEHWETFQGERRLVGAA